jgi:hypothetical protein
VPKAFEFAESFSKLAIWPVLKSGNRLLINNSLLKSRQPEVGKVTLKSNGDEVLSDEFLLKSNDDEALNDVFP